MKRVLVSRIRTVHDGDTFRCDVDTWPKLFGFNIPVRVARINCPEKRRFDGKVPRSALMARNFTYNMLTNANRIVLCNVKRGKYFRLVADVEIDGTDLATALLESGNATKL